MEPRNQQRGDRDHHIVALDRDQVGKVVGCKNKEVRQCIRRGGKRRNVDKALAAGDLLVPGDDTDGHDAFEPARQRDAALGLAVNKIAQSGHRAR